MFMESVAECSWKTHSALLVNQDSLRMVCAEVECQWCAALGVGKSVDVRRPIGGI